MKRERWSSPMETQAVVLTSGSMTLAKGEIDTIHSLGVCGQYDRRSVQLMRRLRGLRR
jgi:hypothetical protein